jgi:N6-L-threonylcarbamoyladenine synthase
MTILGIESSCDETAAAVVRGGNELLSNVVASSMELHAPYGGVVPEIAARSHIEAIIPTITTALDQARTDWPDIDALAVTYGAGLSGSLLVGVLTARTLAIVYKKPLYGINHVEGHVYANFLTNTSLPGYKLPSEQPKFPMLALIVSGGHTQLVIFNDHFDYKVIGRTLDDAVGEAFDKVAKMLGLPYPGGPSIESTALAGINRFHLPKAKLEDKYNFSFSGLKTAVLRLAQEQIGEDYGFPSTKLSDRLSEAQKADIAASFMDTAVDTIVEKTLLAYQEFKPNSVVIAGGVAANQALRHQLTTKLPIAVEYTDIKLCTDNGAMIATLGWYKHAKKQAAADPFGLTPKPNLVM